MLQRYKIFLNGCNITTFFNTIQLFFIGIPQKNIKTTFYLNQSFYADYRQFIFADLHSASANRIR